MLVDCIHSRFELKYLISPRVCDQIRSFIEPFMKPDPNAALRRNYSYPICSLYLDSPDLRLYNQVLAGEKDRFKLRVRAYTDDPAVPVFFEIKRRMNKVLHKRRVPLDRETARGLLGPDVRALPSGLADRLLPDLDEFTSERLLLDARPVVRVKYMREAYESRTDDPVRVTFDTQLCHSLTLDANLSLTEGEWVETPVDGVILEVKFTDRFPTWVADMAQLFQLSACSVPKYVLSVDRVLEGGHSRVVELAGFTVVPQRFRFTHLE